MPEFVSEPQRWVIPAVLIVSVLGTAWALWRERRNPTSYTRRPDALAEWRAMSAAEQEAADTASLDLAEQAVLDAEYDAQEAAQLAVERATEINTLARF
ncbi:hypothetical protein OIA45_48955 (plasmid) [Streptomyces chartreusis]|uniref:hypothetical protein n=1 Tax=Streptomyces chartreusis TaxID=1969 RepID=UPI0037DCF1C4|nr:hypothetical protein OIA45_48955 [Streptomyces chartreusis]